MTSHLKKLGLAVGLALAFSGTGYADPGSITVTNLGPLNSFSINTATFDGASGNIENLTFDLSGTCGGTGCAGGSLVFGGLLSSSFAYDPAANGTSSLFGSVGSAVFGFNFSGFNPLDIFTFSWDPDSTTNSNYGATVADLAGTFITADVRFADNSLLHYAGTMGVVGPDVAANLSPSPVPEPEIYAMMVAGLGLMGFVGRRRRKQGAVA